MMNIFECNHCLGTGEVFEGALMKSNPYDYGDYEEIWTTCEKCKGNGRVYSARNAIGNLVFWARIKLEGRP